MGGVFGHTIRERQHCHQQCSIRGTESSPSSSSSSAAVTGSPLSYHPTPHTSSPGSGESTTLANSPRLDPFVTHLIPIEDLPTPPSPVSETFFGDVEVEVSMEDRVTLEMRDQEVEVEVDALVTDVLPHLSHVSDRRMIPTCLPIIGPSFGSLHLAFRVPGSLPGLISPSFTFRTTSTPPQLSWPSCSIRIVLQILPLVSQYLYSPCFPFSRPLFPCSLFQSLSFPFGSIFSHACSASHTSRISFLLLPPVLSGFSYIYILSQGRLGI